MRIAHFSDLHLLSLSGAKGCDFANKRWIGALNLLVNRGRHHRPELFAAMVKDVNTQTVDHVVCTGDITNLALEEEFQFAREHFEQLSLAPPDVTVIPGNHDTYVAEGIDFFRSHFAEFIDVEKKWRWPDADPWPVVRTHNNIAIIGVSTSITTPWFTAYGEVGPKQLERLSSILGHSDLENMFRLILVHHSPTGRRAQSKVRGFRDGTAFCELVRRHGAELILHGHEHVDLHETLISTKQREIPVRGIPSATYEAGKPALRARYRVYEVSNQISESTQRPSLIADNVRIWHPDLNQFEDLAA